MAKDVKKNKSEKKDFFKSFKAELKKVIWPTPKQLVNNTVAVLVIVLITAVIVFVLDIAFESMNTYGINKLKSFVTSSEEENSEANVENATENNEVSEESSENASNTDEETEDTSHTDEGTETESAEEQNSNETETNNVEEQAQE